VISAARSGVRRAGSPLALIAALGLASAGPYLYLVGLGDLRRHPAQYGLGALAALVLFFPAVFLAVRVRQPLARSWLALIFGVAILLRGVLIFSEPRLSDDMYRYIWDGRVQAHGINPYAYPPDAAELRPLRDGAIWPLINRKGSVTVYPGGAQLAYALLWRIWPDNVRWVQAAIAAAGVVGGLLLLLLLRALGKPEALVLAYLWNPALIIETAHSAHVDGLVLPLVIAAWLACARRRPGWSGVALGMATALKLYPALLAPALLPGPQRGPAPSGRQRMLLALVIVPVAAYLPYLGLGRGVLGFLPAYFGERAPTPLAAAIAGAIRSLGLDPALVANGVLAAGLAAVTLALLLRPAGDPETAVRRCIWPIAVFSVLSQNLLPWYMLWALPLAAIFLRPGRWGLRLDAWAFFFTVSSVACLTYALG
jgi:alpha-1,6-mannosyltransferase